MSWLSPHMKRPWLPPNNPSYSPNNRPWNGNSPRFNSPREQYYQTNSPRFNAPREHNQTGSPRFNSPREQHHYQSNRPHHAPYPRFSPRASFNPRYRNNTPKYSEQSVSSTSAELTGGYRSQQRFQQQFDRHDPFFHPSMLENPWAGLEEDFEEVREDLLENAEELILTIPMTISNWMRKRPMSDETGENLSHEQKVATREGDVRSIAKLADTVSQIEQQLISDRCNSLRKPKNTIDDPEQPKIEPDQELMQPSDFEMEGSSCNSSQEDSCKETIDQTETLSVSIDTSSPLRPSLFNRKSINDSITSVQSPPKMSSQPATPDRVVKPQPVLPIE